MYQYETSPRKLIEYDAPKKKVSKAKSDKKTKKVTKSKISKKQAAAKETKIAKKNFVIIIAVAMICILVIVLRNVQINQSFSEVQTLTKEVSSLEKENSQIKVNIQNSLSLSTIESTATSLLGMQKLSSKQTVYVTLDTKDYVEVNEQSTNEETENIFQKLWNKFLDMF